MYYHLSSSTSKLQASLHFFFFFNDTATTEIYTLSLHDALPIYGEAEHRAVGAVDEEGGGRAARGNEAGGRLHRGGVGRSEEHTSELQSQSNLVCRLLLEKKKTTNRRTQPEGAQNRLWIISSLT